VDGRVDVLPSPLCTLCNHPERAALHAAVQSWLNLYVDIQRVSKSSAKRRVDVGGGAGHDGMPPPRWWWSRGPAFGMPLAGELRAGAVFEPRAQVCRAVRVGRARV